MIELAKHAIFWTMITLGAACVLCLTLLVISAMTIDAQHALRERRQRRRARRRGGVLELDGPRYPWGGPRGS